MKTKIFFLIIVIAVLSFGTVNSQITPSVTRASLLESDRAVLNEHLSEYATFTIDKRELIDSLYTIGKCRFQIHIDEQRNWIFDLEFNDMRAPDFRQTYITEEGEFEPEEPYILNIFKGKTSDNRIVRFTIDENTFFGVILDDRDHYVIRPAKDYTKNSLDESLIVYKSSDIIANDEEQGDYINDAIRVPVDNENEIMEQQQDMLRSSVSYTPCKWYLKIATDADYQFYTDRGNSNLARTYSEIFSVLNLVEAVYESTFNMQFIVTFQNVYTTSNTPYTSNNADILLFQFQTYWNLNRGNVSRKIAHLFTGKDLGSTVGVAFVGHIGDPFSYSLSKNRTDMHRTTAHEIGHNFNADHPSASDCQCGYSTASVMCSGNKSSNLWFCGKSISEILPFIHDNKSHLTGSVSTSLNLSGSLSGFNAYEVQQTITSTQVINSGHTSYKAGQQIVLSPGFHAKSGSVFTAAIHNNSNCNHNWSPIIVPTWTNITCKYKELRFFNVANAVSYRVIIQDRYKNKIYENTEIITGNPISVWDAPVVGSFLAQVSFYSPVYETSKTYPIDVVYGIPGCAKSASAMLEDDDDEITLETSDNHFDFDIFPNPNDGNFTLKLNMKEIEPFFVEILDSYGALVSKTEYYDEYQVDINYSSLPQGIYFVKLTMGSNVSTRKVIIQ